MDEFVNADVLQSYFEGKGETLEEAVNTAKADDFYERILVGYGDDSVAELGGGHVALEEVSMLAAKIIEEHRIGLSPLEKSTRYVYYDQKVNGEYQYVKDPAVMASEHKDLYCNTITQLMDAYSRIARDLQPLLRVAFPGDENEAAYKFSIRAKACDLARGLLPTATKTNMGVYGNGRAYEYLITHLLGDELSEVRQIGALMDESLKKIISAFIKRATNERGKQYREYLKATKRAVSEFCADVTGERQRASGISVRILESDEHPLESIIASLLYTHAQVDDFEKALAIAHAWSEQKKEEMLKRFLHARSNRHHKPGRELEQAMVTFEVVCDWGAYKDLQRHRVLTRHRQLYTNELGYWTPEEIAVSEFRDVYTHAMEKAVEAYGIIKQDFPYEAQYLVPHGSYNRFVMRMNLRAIVHMAELRASPQGHPTYRKVAQEMVRRVAEKFPLLGKYCFPFVDFNEYGLERLDAFRRLEKKASAAGVKGFEE